MYKYTCESCRAFYIGKTESQYRCRICQHLGTSPRTVEEIRVKVKSDIREHCLKCKNHVNPENFEIIDKLHSNKDILILESLHQKTKKPSIDIHTQSTPLLWFDSTPTHTPHPIRLQFIGLTCYPIHSISLDFLSLYLILFCWFQMYGWWWT